MTNLNIICENDVRHITHISCNSMQWKLVIVQVTSQRHLTISNYPKRLRQYISIYLFILFSFYALYCVVPFF